MPHYPLDLGARTVIDLPIRLLAIIPIARRGRLDSFDCGFDRGFARSLFLLEEVTEELRSSEKSTSERLVRLISHDVGNSVAAVVSLLESAPLWSPALPPAERADLSSAMTLAAELGFDDPFSGSEGWVKRCGAGEVSQFNSA
jgi:hypothetical protein